MTVVSASRLDRAVRLFEFLAQMQQSAISTPRTYDRLFRAQPPDLKPYET